MEMMTKENKEQLMDRYSPELDKKIFAPSPKLKKAKAYFQEHGFPDLDKLTQEAKEKQTK